MAVGCSGECEDSTFDEAFRLSLLNSRRFLLAVRVNDGDVTSLLIAGLVNTERLIGLGL